jgi:hypothetical protein
MQPSKTLGQIGYEAYADAGRPPGSTWDGRVMPPWSEVSEGTARRWEAAAGKIAEEHNKRLLSDYARTRDLRAAEQFEDDLPTTRKGVDP